MSDPAARPGFEVRDSGRSLDAALRQALGARGAGRRAIAFAAPAAAAERLWSLARAGETSVFWAPPDGPRVAGLGEVASVRLAAGSRDDPARAAAGLLDGIEVISTPGAPAVEPLLVGGAPFDAGRPSGPFAALGAGRLLLPRWTYVASGGRAALLLVVDHRAPEEDARELLSRTRSMLEALAGPSRPEGERPRPTARRWRPPAAEAWRARFDAARRAISSGALHKLVIAHAGAVEGDERIDAAAVLAHLVRRDDPVTVFGLRQGDVAFVGATPETLFSLRDGHVVADALAGTISAPAGTTPRAIADRFGERLLASAKDRREQQIVVDAVREALAPLCRSIQVPARPAVRALGRVAHLSTPISGELLSGVGWNDLVRALHPTPAVGGHPRALALQRLAEIEPETRGWFAGPFGAVDGSGHARFCVAIRSALIEGPRASVWAGAGIVEGSLADAEYDETLAKMRRLRAALGAPE